MRFPGVGPVEGYEAEHTVKGAEHLELACLDIHIYFTPGHSPGSMSVAVETADGPYVIAGDAVMTYDNLRGDPAKRQKFLPIGRYTDIFQVFDSLELILSRAGGVIEHVLPGHDATIVGQQWPR